MNEKQLKKKVIKKFHKKTQDAYEELYLGRCVADVALLSDDSFVGYEIKSPLDSLKRWNESQKWTYCYFFDVVWLVVDPKHVAKAIIELEKPIAGRGNGFVSNPWGLMDSDWNIYVYPSENKWPARDHRFYQLDALWAVDLRVECKKRKIKPGRKSAMIDRLLEVLNFTEVRQLVRKYIILHKEIKRNE